MTLRLPKIRPPLFCQSGENFRSDSPIALPLPFLIWFPLRRSERLDDIRSAHNADELAILDDGARLIRFRSRSAAKSASGASSYAETMCCDMSSVTRFPCDFASLGSAEEGAD
jgi:hypothetical protein